MSGPQWNGWLGVEKKRSHYSIGYRASFVLGMLSDRAVPPRI